jgi:glycosyltransferase involved in cell wall biosynthesis
VFTGAMDYRPNIDAVLWFADEILPRLLARRPDLRFAVVGARPSPAVRRLATRPGILVTGRVPDIRPWLAHATLVVAPLRIARGVQNKVLEAMAMARPVLCTPAAAMGLELTAGKELAIADGTHAFAIEALALIDEPRRCRAMAAAARHRVTTDYNWRLPLADLEHLIRTPCDALGRSRC